MRLTTRVLYSTITVIALFGILELALRVIGLGNPPIVGKLDFGYRTGIPIYDEDGIEEEGNVYPLPLFESDTYLFWRPVSDSAFTGLDGLRKPLPTSRNKAAGVFRIGVLGDSCSFVGRDLYVTQFGRLLAEHGLEHVDIVNSSCPGYSSFQGARRVEEVMAWQPDMLIVYFGWNDHWKSLNGKTDAYVAESRRVAGNLEQYLQKLHLYWMLSNLLSPTARSIVSTASPMRVPLEQYDANLRRIGEAAKQRSCQFLLITAPTAFVDDHMPDWAFRFFAELYHMNEEEIRSIPEIHRQYNDIVREIGRDLDHAVVADLARLWQGDDLWGRFRSDCIHLTEKGHRDAAEAILNAWSEGFDK